MKFCPRLVIFEPLDCTLEIFRGCDLSIFKYCYFWIDILGFLIQIFEPAPPPRMFSCGVPPQDEKLDRYTDIDTDDGIKQK